MDIRQAYLMALQKSEQNLANGGIKMDPGRFVLLFNSAQDRMVEYYINRKDDETIKSIQRLLVYWKDLSRKSHGDNPECTYFSLPNDFRWFSNIQGTFKSGECMASDFLMWDTKNENVHELMADLNNRPSFDYRETFYSIGDDSIVVYEDNFRTVGLRMTYYRSPRIVDLEGYIKADGSKSTNIDPEMDDLFVEKVLNMMTKQFDLNERELEKYQFDKDNVSSIR